MTSFSAKTVLGWYFIAMAASIALCAMVGFVIVPAAGLLGAIPDVGIPPDLIGALVNASRTVTAVAGTCVFLSAFVLISAILYLVGMRVSALLLSIVSFIRAALSVGVVGALVYFFVPLFDFFSYMLSIRIGMIAALLLSVVFAVFHALLALHLLKQFLKPEAFV